MPMHRLLVDPKPRNWLLVAGIELVLSHTARLGRPERDDRLEAHRAKTGSLPIPPRIRRVQASRLNIDEKKAQVESIQQLTLTVTEKS
jgi:hypothetical protein